MFQSLCGEASRAPSKQLDLFGGTNVLSTLEPGKIAPWLKALAVILGDPSSVSSTNTE